MFDTECKIKNNFTEVIDVKCKHSCTILQYSGLEVEESSKFSSEPELHDVCKFMYQFGNTDNR